MKQIVLLMYTLSILVACSGENPKSIDIFGTPDSNSCTLSKLDGSNVSPGYKHITKPLLSHENHQGKNILTGKQRLIQIGSFPEVYETKKAESAQEKSMIVSAADALKISILTVQDNEDVALQVLKEAAVDGVVYVIEDPKFPYGEIFSFTDLDSNTEIKCLVK